MTDEMNLAVRTGTRWNVSLSQVVPERKPCFSNGLPVGEQMPLIKVFVQALIPDFFAGEMLA